MAQQQNSGKLGIGLIGYGGWGQHLARMATNQTTTWIPMIWTRSEGTAEKIRGNGFAATTNVDELIEHPEVKAVIVASPNALHKEHCLKVAAAGKALWAEKPLVLNLADYDEIVAAVEKAGIVNHCNFGMRFQPTCRKMIELADAGEFGEPMHLISRSSRGVGLFSLGTAHKAVLHPELSGGWVMHHMCHQVDFAIRLTRQPVVRVFAQKVASAPDAPSEESIAAVCTTAGGAILQLADGLAPQADLHHTSYLGTKALAYATNGRELNFRGTCDENVSGSGGWSTLYTPSGFPDDSMAAFVAAVSGTKHNRWYPLDIVPIREGRHALEVLLAINESAEKNQPVELAELGR